MLNKKLAEMNENGTLPIFKNYLANISANPTKVKSLSDFAEDGWYEVTDVDGFEKYLVYHYAEGKKISVRYIFGKTPKIQEANPKGFFGEIADVISVFAYDSTLAVSKLKTEEGDAVKLVGYDSEGNLVEDDIPEGIVVDDALNTESDNAIANAPVATALNEKANTEALLDGTLIPNKALQAKSIEAVSTESGAVQDTPFIYQGTGTANGTSIADTSPVGKHLEKQGNSVVVNQLVSKPFFTDGTTGWYASHMSQSVSGGVDTLTVTEESQACEISCTINSIVSGHKYLLFVSHQSAQVGSINATISKSNWSAYTTMGVDTVSSTNVWRTYTRVVTATFSGTSAVLHIYPIGGNAQVGDIAKIRGVIFIDLTQWFAGNIPQDLLDHPENFLRYYNGSLAYNAGSMENGTGRYLTCGGRNVWDEEWELGQINHFGNNAESSNQIRSKNYIPVIPNTSYYVYYGAWSLNKYGLMLRFYDANKNYIGSDYASCTQFVAPSNCRFVRFCTNADALAVTTYNHNITISLYYATGDSYDQYYPYEEPKVYDTGSEVLRSAGSVRDVKAPDGTITRKANHAILNGTENWARNTTNDTANKGYYFYTDDFTDAQNNAQASDFSNITSDKAVAGTANWMYGGNDSAPILISFWVSMNRICIYSREMCQFTVDQFKAWLASNNIEINYQKAEPTTEQGTPFAENIEINDYGTMGWDSEVPQGCKIFYPADYALFIDSVGQRQDINWDALAIVSHDELDDETDALEAKDTQLLNAVGGTLRQLLAVSKSIDFANTDFVDLGDLDWSYVSQYSLFQSNSLDGIMSAFDSSSQNAVCTLYKNTTNDLVYIGNLTMRKADHLYVKNTAYADATAFKNAMKGVLLAYEKASE